MSVRAAGAVVRTGDRVCIVHRPAYDDWSLPKGKLKAGEHPLRAAVRELLEETGVRGEPLLRLPEVSYDLPDGRPKTVDFWLMRGVPGAFEAGDEVDEVAFVTPEAALERFSYATDRDVLAHATAVEEITAVTPIVRHAHAGERKKWSGNDALRPIDPQGLTESEALAEVLILFGPRRLFAATPLRCKQTLEPLAAKLDLPIVMDAAFAEPADPDEIDERVRAGLSRLAELRAGPTAVACSQGKLMPHLLSALVGEADSAVYKTPKGGGWVIAWSGENAAGLSRL
ncbi:NUDIX hydrolase [Actinoplanes sp. NPDC051633]|uniref:NUDIX hydrolase n=1 Tax=Actinoplanes sp. NPDC051633 TaxID=3155670 RepID=UPI00342E1129